MVKVGMFEILGGRVVVGNDPMPRGVQYVSTPTALLSVSAPNSEASALSQAVALSSVPIVTGGTVSSSTNVSTGGGGGERVTSKV